MSSEDKNLNIKPEKLWFWGGVVALLMAILTSLLGYNAIVERETALLVKFGGAGADLPDRWMLYRFLITKVTAMSVALLFLVPGVIWFDKATEHDWLGQVVTGDQGALLLGAYVVGLCLVLTWA